MDEAGRRLKSVQIISRRKARRKAFELVFEAEQHPSTTIDELLERTFEYNNWYQKKFGLEPEEEIKSSFLYENEDEPTIVEIDDNNERFIRDLCTLTLKNIDLLDSILTKYPEEWKFERIGTPEKCILRMALAEILFMDTPIKVVINEALDITKLYGEHDANRFLNGILGAIVRDLDDIKRKFNAKKA